MLIVANTNIKRHREIRPVKLALLTTCLLSTVCCSPSPLPIGATIPDVNLTRLNGTPLSTRDLEPPFVAVFFDSKCPACKVLLEELLKLQLPAEQASRIVLLTSSEPSIRPSVLLQLRSPVLMLDPVDWKSEFGIRSTPTLLYFGNARKLARIQIGARSSSALKRGFAAFFGEQ